ncbi:hypothetical protein, partial [Wolbachia endosymbiont of Pentidionis agamae]|uniref:hypothetical protein n=1 Tax=Wolbachia endosymbiont of Pentidionis agamae TaxID=3110435 RepID=UPI002FCEEA06
KADLTLSNITGVDAGKQQILATAVFDAKDVSNKNIAENKFAKTDLSNLDPSKAKTLAQNIINQAFPSSNQGSTDEQQKEQATKIAATIATAPAIIKAVAEKVLETPISKMSETQYSDLMGSPDSSEWSFF